jgi:CheY-like chemotaxis protein
MPNFSIPTCFFPTTALFIDDNRDFLLNFVLQLDEWLAYRVFDSPIDALESIQKKYREHDLITYRCAKGNTNVSPSFLALYQEVYNPARFCDVSVVVVDYAMPGMNGLDFCRHINQTKIKRILLTGKTDEKLAKKALEEGLIHRYINKSDPAVVELITQSVSELQLQYFQDMSDELVSLLPILLPGCFHDESFAQFFRNLCHENGIVEYYLLNDSGTFMLLDVDAQISFLLIKNKAQLGEYYSLARDNSANNIILDQLARGEKIPLFEYEKNNKSAWNIWVDNLISANFLIANEDYYYAHVQEPLLLDIHQDKLLSYHSHLQKIDVEELLLV